MTPPPFIPRCWLDKIQRSGYLFVSHKTLREINPALLSIFLRENGLDTHDVEGGIFIRESKKQLSGLQTLSEEIIKHLL